MITQERQELLHILSQISELAPEVRLGQLVANLTTLARAPANESVWDVEDGELLQVARGHLEAWRALRSMPAPASVDVDVAPTALPQVSNP